MTSFRYQAARRLLPSQRSQRWREPQRRNQRVVLPRHAHLSYGFQNLQQRHCSSRRPAILARSNALRAGVCRARHHDQFWWNYIPKRQPSISQKLHHPQRLQSVWPKMVQSNNNRQRAQWKSSALRRRSSVRQRDMGDLRVWRV